MKIVHLIGYFQPEFGYKEFYIARNQVKLGHEVYVVTSDRIFPFPNLPELCKKINIPFDRRRKLGWANIDGIKVLRLPTAFECKGAIYIRGIKKALQQIKPDIVHAYETVQFTPVLAAWYKRYNTYFLISDHQQFELPQTILGKVYFYCFSRFLSNYMFKKADVVIFPTNGSIAFAKQRLAISEEKIKMIPLGYDPELFYFSEHERTVLRKKIGLHDNDILLITAGRLSKQKKIEIVFKAMRQLKAEKRIILMIMGSGDENYIKELKKMAEEFNLSKQVIFKEFTDRKELFKYYSAADFGIWPEQPSITIIEAIGCKLPLILPDRKTVDHLIQYNNGLTYQRNNYSDLNKQLDKILHAPKAVRQAFKQGALKAQSEFSYKNIAKRIVDLAY